MAFTPFCEKQDWFEVQRARAGQGSGGTAPFVGVGNIHVVEQ
jgi:hypothetical protein